MGLTYADIEVTSWGSNKSLAVKALVDTGATMLCLTKAQAVQLGFDLAEVRHINVTLATGAIQNVPVIEPLSIHFGDRSCTTQALVLGDEALMGCVPLELMDLVIEPKAHKIVANPDHPNYPVLHAK